ncbi:MAG TPA: terminase TerL endonuclease subunit [Methylosinus sp.]|jgi:phage terminase large subunit-like protein|uniref:terminase TerL endonuclease subunit n=1 Tax=Methylosinus sp. TaxID=427 RepID=UPI002F9569CC
MTEAEKAIAFIEGLTVPTGPLSGQPIALAPYQRQFLEGALASGVTIGVLSVARGAGKSALTAGVALGHLLGEIDPQPRRECLVGARTRDQARVIWDYISGLARSLPDNIQKRLTFRRAPRLEIEFDDEAGPHIVCVLPADGRTALGTSPTLCVLDERGHWEKEKGDALEHALLSGVGKRGGRMLLVSTSASDDAHAFSRWIDEPLSGSYVQEHRAPDGCAPDDLAAIKAANPGAEYGVGASLEWLEAQARRAVARGGSALTAWRLYNLNQRVADENRSVLITADQWLSCETDDLFFAGREGPVIVGIDLGGSASMSAAAFYWPATGRLEAVAHFPSKPSLLDRGHIDGVSGRYVEMHNRGELFAIGDATVPVAAWLSDVMTRIEGQPIGALVMDRFKQSELAEAINRAGIRAPLVWRGFGWKDGSEDIERFRRSVFDGKVKARPSLLLRSAFADAITLVDPAGNHKLAKGRSNGRIDAAAATLLAVAEGARATGRASKKPRAVAWV